MTAHTDYNNTRPAGLFKDLILYEQWPGDNDYGSSDYTEACFLRHAGAPNPEKICIAGAEEAAAFLSGQDPALRATLFVSGCDDALIRLSGPFPCLRLVCVSADLIDLFDSLTAWITGRTLPDPFDASPNEDDPEQQMYLEDSRTLSALLADVTEHHLSDPVLIRARMHSLSSPPRRFMRILVIGPEDSDANSDNLPAQLQPFFPSDTITVFDGQAVVLLSHPDRVAYPEPFPPAHPLYPFLAQEHLCAGLSNATSQHAMIGTCFTLARHTLMLGRALRDHPKQRLFFFEDYAEYFMIDLCRNSFQSLLGHDDLIYLTHPDAIRLARYDQAHGTDLLTVLYHYCQNGENIVRTAEDAFMHRNTVTTRMNRIRQLIGADLSDGRIRQRMIFSYKLLQYDRRYLKADMEKLLRENPDQP